MTTNSGPAEGCGRLSARAVVVPMSVSAEVIPMSRLAPASGMSVVCHLFLLAAFAILAPRSQADGPMEVRNVDIIETDPDDDPNRPAFEATMVNRHDIESPGDPSSNSWHLGEMVLPAIDPVGPLGAPGDNIGKNLEFPQLPSGTELRAGTLPSVEGPNGAKIDSGPVGSSPIIGSTNPAFSGRGGLMKESLLKGVGTSASEAAVSKGLNWLVRVQSPAGMWKLDGNFPDKGNANDVGGTALGLLPFLGAGKTHKSTDNSPGAKVHSQAVDKALQYLIAVQDKKTGAFSRDMYAHGLATIAVSEAFALSQDYNLKKPAQLAINFIVSAQHSAGGWRYSPGQAGDLSVSGWQIMALKSGIMAGLDVPPASLRRAQAFLDHVVEPKSEGSGYTDPIPTPTMTSVALLCRQYLNGWGPQNLRLIKGVDNFIKPNFPRPERKDVYYYYYATQVMHNLGGDDWKSWNAKMREQLVASQEAEMKDATRWGSWSPAGDQWGQAGGRLMVTSLNLLTLEVYYRYLPLYHREAAR